MLWDDPSMAPNAVEEILRYESSVQAIVRTVAEPLELRAVMLTPTDIVVSLVGAVSRDPAMFENPDRFDMTRKDLRPLSFGGGVHFCLGAQLARIEAAVAFETILRRLPQLRLVEPDRPKWRPSFLLRDLTELPVAWG
jgi:cytochrome P450